MSGLNYVGLPGLFSAIVIAAMRLLCSNCPRSTFIGSLLLYGLHAVHQMIKLARVSGSELQPLMRSIEPSSNHIVRMFKREGEKYFTCSVGYLFDRPVTKYYCEINT